MIGLRSSSFASCRSLNSVAKFISRKSRVCLCNDHLSRWIAGLCLTPFVLLVTQTATGEAGLLVCRFVLIVGEFERS